MGQPVRKPFSWKGGLWVCVGIRGCRDAETAEAYRLIHPHMFDGNAASHATKTWNGSAARADACGFYHGVSVKHASAEFVLCGPPVTFTQEQSEQLSLL